MTRAPINKILPYSVVDGPGNRAVVFLQGCNIACAYCHNPETQRLCRGCGVCVERCPSGALTAQMAGENPIWDESLCTDCGKCLAACQFSASPKVHWMTPPEVYSKVYKSVPFIRGVTVSGGECTLYPAFVQELFTLAQRDGLGCLIDTNGTLDFLENPDLLALCDGVMLDVKSWDPAIYRALTSGENDVVKRNITVLHKAGKLHEIRIVCLPGEVDASDIVQELAKLLGNDVANIPLKLIRFRHNGVRGRLATAPTPNDTYMNALAAKAQSLGFKYSIV